MNNETIEKAKINYEKLVHAKRELINIKRELLMEEQTSRVRKCLRVVRKTEDKFSNDEQTVRNSFYSARSDNDTSNIYVFVGAYKYGKKRNDVKVSDYRKANYFVYQDLEKEFSGTVIYPQEMDKFEKDNVILRFDSSLSFSEFLDKFYYLQYLYFKEYLNNKDISQDKVITKLKQYYK